MEQFLLHYQGEIAGGLYVAVALVALWEGLRPRRSPTAPLAQRWLHNGLLFLCLMGLSRLLVPATAVGAALFAQQQGWGLLPAPDQATAVHYVAAVLGLDLLRYALHRLMHRVPVLWRMHRTHHTDRDVDLSTAFRFHPLEMVSQSAVNGAAVLALGLSPGAVIAYEAGAFLVNAFSHGNGCMGARAERWLRWLIVTPDMHRVHHSREPAEYNANLGAMFSIWDRLFGTYVAQPAAGHEAIELGVPGFDAPRHRTLGWMLVNPFVEGDAAKTPSLGRGFEALQVQEPESGP